MRVRGVVGLLLRAGLVVVVAGLVSGCQEAEPEPRMPKATSSPSPVETVSSAPVERESAAEFIRRWQAAGDEMQVTGETEEYSAMGPRCQACQGFVDSVEAVYSKGGHAEFEGSTITKLVRVGEQPPTFELTKTVPETVIHHRGGRVQKYPAGDAMLRITLERRSGEWAVTHYGFV